uniref:Uncharacterized protein n=1 Tax=viral metagenome TaxID=1070528 RepID=A0A6M3XG09_9ZZZZ
MKFRTTKQGVAICPFFTWTSEDKALIERQGHSENDVSLTLCVHPDNPNDYEGNCNKTNCPLSKLQRIMLAKEQEKP